MVVVGAGPGGLVAGEYAARKGASVLVVDKKREIGTPVRCAEGLGAINFELIGLEPSRDFVMNTVNKVWIFSPKGKKLEINIPYKEFSLHILDRSGFEKALAKRLTKAGGRIVLDTVVSGLVKKEHRIVGVKTSKGEIRGKVIIGADGVESRIGRWCNLTKRLKLNEIFSTAQQMLVDLDGVDDHVEIHFNSRFAPGGYAWVFPKGGGEANFGLGILGTYKKKPIELLSEFKQERAKDAHATRLVTGCIPSTLPPQKTVKDNVLLVGDSARQTNAVSGGGIANALIAGKFAGEVAGKVACGNQPISNLSEYERLWRNELENTLIKKFKQRRFLENDKKKQRIFAVLKLVLVLKPLIPKSMVVRWLRPNF